MARGVPNLRKSMLRDLYKNYGRPSRSRKPRRASSKITFPGSFPGASKTTAGPVRYGGKV